MAAKISGGILLAVVLATATANADGTQPPVGAPPTYPACAKPPSKGEMDAAHYAYLAGRHSFDEGDYATAITYFKDAYRRDCTKHELLPIIARAYELSQNRSEALLALETFLKRVPATDPNVEPVKKRVANLKTQTEGKPSLAATPPSGTSPPPGGASPESAPPAAAPAPGPSPPRPEAEPKRSPGPWIVVGAGVVVAAIGTVMVVGGLNKRSDATARCPNSGLKGRTCPPNVDSAQVQRDYDDGTSQATIGGILLPVGAAAVIGGVVWRLVDGSASTPVAFAPWLGPTHAGVAWTNAF